MEEVTKEFRKIACTLESFYDFMGFDDEFKLQMWYEALKDIPSDILLVVIKKWVSTSPKKPTVADLRELAVKLQVGALDVDKAWEKVSYAIRCIGRYRPEEAMESFDDITKEAVKSIGFVNLCNDENAMAHFRDMYKIACNRYIDRAKTPASINQLTDNMILMLEKK